MNEMVNNAENILPLHQSVLNSPLAYCPCLSLALKDPAETSGGQRVRMRISKWGVEAEAGTITGRD